MQPIANSRLVNTASFLVILLAFGYLGYIGKPVVMPMVFAIFFAFLLHPLCRRFERWKFGRVPAILCSMLLVILLVFGIIWLFSTQFYYLFANLSDFKITVYDTLNLGLARLAEIPWLQENAESLLKSGGQGLLNKLSGMLSATLLNSTAFIGHAGMVLVYVFLFLLYRTAFRKFILSWFSGERQEEIGKMLYQFQSVTRSYFGGLLLAMLILGTVNTLGLYFIGIDHAFLFGFFAACLTVIPYIGTTLGGTLPFLYALLYYDEIWRAAAVVIMYALVQALEGNYITPKIVGDKVSINPLIAIIALIFGGIYWGLAGMILSLPLIAITRILLENFESTRRFGYLLSNRFN